MDNQFDVSSRIIEIMRRFNKEQLTYMAAAIAIATEVEQYANFKVAERMYSEEDMIFFAEFVATYSDKNKNVHGQMLHAKSKYDGAERTIDLFKIWYKQFKKK